MHRGRLTKLGNSWAVIVPRKHMEYLGWFPGDEVEQDTVDGHLVMKSLTQHSVRPLRKAGEFSDASNARRIE